MKYFAIFILCLCTICSGCSATTEQHFTSPAIGLGYIKNIAVLPLADFSKEKGITERSRELLITKLLAHKLYGVVESGELHHFLRNHIRTKEKALIDQTVAKQMAREFNIEAYMAGSIDEYTMVRNGNYSYPVIAMTLRMVDIKTGEVLWHASADDSGYSATGRLFGLNAEGTNAVLFRLIDRLLSTMNDIQ